MNASNDLVRYIGSLVVYRGRSRFLCRDTEGFYVVAAIALQKCNYIQTGSIRRLTPWETIVVHGKETRHLTIPR